MLQSLVITSLLMGEPDTSLSTTKQSRRQVPQGQSLQRTQPQPPTRAELLVACAGPDRHALDDIVAKAQHLRAEDRALYVRDWLGEHGVSADECAAVLHSLVPTRITRTVGSGITAVEAAWAPVDDDVGCLRAVTLTTKTKAAQVFEFPDPPFCFPSDEAQPLRQEDFNFDGRLDLRLVGTLHMAQSRRFDLIFLATADGRFSWSLELSRLDTVEVDSKKRRLSSRHVNGAEPSTVVWWRFSGEQLVELKTPAAANTPR
jgi:hypothetical protein